MSNTIERPKPVDPPATGLHAGRLAAIKDQYTGAEGAALVDRRMEQMSESRYLGDLSATPPGRSIGLHCSRCNVHWTGCMDASACPECGDTSAYEELTRARYDKANAGDRFDLCG